MSDLNNQQSTNVLIIGLGLIGGSLARAFQRKSAYKIYGYDTNVKSMEKAHELQYIHEIITSLEDEISSMHIVIFATPVNTTIHYLKTMKEWNLPSEIVFSDTGSTKKQIVDYVEDNMPSHFQFIGGHPMAGSHKSGIEAAKPHLFENAFYLICPSIQCKKESIQALSQLLTTTKSKLIEVQATEHDEMTATISHFPHIVAAALVHHLDSKTDMYPQITKLAAGGFRDITRIASSNPIMWRDISMQNRSVLIEQLRGWTMEMNRICEMLETENEELVEKFFSKAKVVRDDLPISQQGALHSTFDLFIDIPDFPGVIAQITTLLAVHQLSIVNLRIVETREDIYGILIISFQTHEDRMKARDVILEQTIYDAFIQ